jgi:hypothetical protein
VYIMEAIISEAVKRAFSTSRRVIVSRLLLD